MEKIIATLMVLAEKVSNLFSDDEAFDPSWMDAEAWKKTRL